MYVIVSYDIVLDRRRRRIHQALGGYLAHVQKSVFEGELPESRYPKLLALLAREMDQEVDSVRVYRICERCRPATEVLGVGVYVEPEGDVIL